MPRKPIVSTLNANSVGILNTIRDSASPDYRQAVPTAEQTTASINAVGTAIMGLESRRNEFINALVNRIAMVLVTSKSYDNPLAVFKRGFVELGETIEEIFVQIATGYQFDPEKSETTVFKRHIPDVKTMFHAINFMKYYPVTISNDMLRTAFLSWDGVTDLITRIVNSIYSGMSYDEYLMIKYMVAVLAIKGNISPSKIADYTAGANSDAVVSNVKMISNNMEFMRTDYNVAGVNNFCVKDDQYLIETSDFSANVDVYSLAKAFNLDYVKFAGKQIMVDSFAFTTGEISRITDLLDADSSFDPTIFNATNLTLLKSIGALLVDRNFFMIFDNLQEATSIYNAEGLYYNEFLHVWKTFSASPFADAVLFTTSETSITAVTVTPDAVSVAKGGSVQLTAAVTGTGFYNHGVVWALDASATASTIDSAGLVKIGAAETATSIVATATSAEDSTKTNVCTITVT